MMRWMRFGVVTVCVFAIFLTILLGRDKEECIYTKDDIGNIIDDQNVLLQILPDNYIVASVNKDAEIYADILGIEDTEKHVERFVWLKSIDGTYNNAEVFKESNSPVLSCSLNKKSLEYYYCVAILYNHVDNTKTKVTSDIIYVANTGLPTICINTAEGYTPTEKKEKIEGYLSVLYPDGTAYNSLQHRGRFKVSVRGNATSSYPKKPYKLKLPKSINLINPASVNDRSKKWILLASYTDKSLVRERIGFWVASLFNNLEGNKGYYVPHSKYVDVVLNGKYMGTYILTDDPVERDKDRIVVDEATNKKGILNTGFIAEMDNYYEAEPKWFETKLAEFCITFKYPDTDYVNFDDDILWFERYINFIEESLMRNDDKWQEYIDLESFARWYLIQNIVANVDPNYYFIKQDMTDKTKLVMGPVWDFEWSMGIGWYDGERPRPVEYWGSNRWIFKELVKNEAFTSEIKRQWELLNNHYPGFADLVLSKMDELADEISVSRQMNFYKWSILDEKISVGGVPLGDYESELECDKEFMHKRIKWIGNAIENEEFSLYR